MSLHYTLTIWVCLKLKYTPNNRHFMGKTMFGISDLECFHVFSRQPNFVQHVVQCNVDMSDNVKQQIKSMKFIMAPHGRIGTPIPGRSWPPRGSCNVFCPMYSTMSTCSMPLALQRELWRIVGCTGENANLWIILEYAEQTYNRQWKNMFNIRIRNPGIL